ncbi:MAG: glycosyltransferase family 1 protein [Candidatus Roizmanbacteria bacterium]
MRIGIDISQIVYEGTGVARFTDGFLRSALTYHNNHQWIFFCSSFRRQLDKNLITLIQRSNQTLIQLPIPPRGLSFISHNLHSLSRELHIFNSLFNRIDWFITSDWAELPLSCKKATIVHDLVFKRYPETVDPVILKTQMKRLEWIEKESEIVFCDSKSTADDLREFYNIDINKICVNYPGVENRSVNVHFVEKTIKKYNLKKPFLLAVGKVEPRKNLKRLIEAFLQIDEKDTELIIVGPQGWDKLDNINDKRIQFLGYISDDELTALYTSCYAFILPSLWEGFGYPIIEAMHQGAPVLTSNISSLEEITHKHAIHFDPFNIKNIKDSIHLIFNDKKLRTKLSLEGKIYAESFTWKRYIDTFITKLTS